MPPISLLPAVDELLDQVPGLLEHVLKTEIETRAVTSHCIDLGKQIEELKKAVVQERMKQKIVEDKLATAQSHARQHSERKTNLTSTSALASRRNKSSLHAASESPVSLRSKRKGRVFEEDTNQMTSKRIRLDKENHRSVDRSRASSPTSY